MAEDEKAGRRRRTVETVRRWAEKPLVLVYCHAGWRRFAQGWLDRVPDTQNPQMPSVFHP